jgi:hypothetical protein
MKRFFIALAVSLSVVFGVSNMAMAIAPGIDGPRDEVCEGITGGGCTTAGGNDISRVLRAVLQILSWVAGIAAVIMIIVAGLKYITSGGDSSSVASAKQSLIYALVGVIFVALAQAIVRFVLGEAAG